MKDSLYQKFKQDCLKIKDRGTEVTYYRPLQDFLEDFANEVKIKGISTLAIESSKEHETEVGFPDITVTQRGRSVGWIEIKPPDEKLNSQKFKKQFERYQESLENIVFTNLKKWELWQWNKDDKPEKKLEVDFDIINYQNYPEDKLEKLLIRFLELRLIEVRTPQKLAVVLARKAKLLREQVEKALKISGENDHLPKLKETFEKTLIQNITDSQFASMVAETMTYSLLLAILEYSKRDHGEFTLTTATDYLPESIPILTDLYSLIKKVSDSMPSIKEAMNLIIEQLKYTDINKIYKDLSEHGDNVIYFYEPFLTEYDPKEKKNRGVYYTPPEIADYIIRSVDSLLNKNFGKKNGLSDETVHILDPAVGTGTFLYYAIQSIWEKTKKEIKVLGEDIVKKEFNKIVVNHVLKHFYGFEILVAPYAVAHLKITLLLRDLGFDFSTTKNDDDSNNDRLKIYLTNALEDPRRPVLDLLPFFHIADEIKNANKVKLTEPIIAIIGNPPYSGISLNMQPEMRNLIDRYKKVNGEPIKERGALQLEKNLNDDYVKFISFAQSLIENKRQGILAFITNNGFLDNPTLRGMRNNLFNSFDEIYILNLHGNFRRGEKEGDESVFNIKAGNSISIFVKLLPSQQKPNKKVKYFEIIGSKNKKLSFLKNNDIFKTEGWKNIIPKHEMYYFVPREEKLEDEYNDYFSLNKVFIKGSAGIITARDNFVIRFDKKDIITNLNKFKENIDINDDDKFCSILGISNKKGWSIPRAKKEFRSISDFNNYIVDLSYRPFDKRKIFYHKSLIWGMSQPVMRNILGKKNLNLVVCRQVNEEFRHVFVTNLITESCLISNKSKEINYIYPLYLYTNSESEQIDLLSEEKPRPNLSTDLIKDFSEKLGLEFIPTGQGDLKRTFGAEDVFYYIYAILHSSSFRNRYSEQLKSDIPKVPTISDKDLLKKLVNEGKKLVSLHLLGNNPFDKDSKNIFDEPEKWGINIGKVNERGRSDWQITSIDYKEKTKRLLVNENQYLEGIEKEIWEFKIGTYQICEKWLKDRKKEQRNITNELKDFMKIIVSIGKTIKVITKINDLTSDLPIK